jgi:iron complex outermembrane receptor protein
MKGRIHSASPFIRLMAVGFFLFAVTPTLTAQDKPCTLTLSGDVIDSETREPLYLARIELGSTGKGAMTLESGAFSIRNICAGTYQLRITHLGCDTLLREVILSEDTHIDFELPHSQGEAVHITAEGPRQKSTQAESIIKGQQLWSTRGGTLADGLEKEAGVSMLRTGNSIAKPIIHGLHGNRILILNNGIRQEGQQWGNEHGPEIDPFVADQLVVVKGANTVRYGPDAIAGVVLVEPRPLRDTAGYAGELNLTGATNGRLGAASALVEGKWAKIQPLSFRLQGTLRRGGNVQTPDYYLKNTGLKEANYSAALGWKKKRYGADVFYSLFQTDIGIFSGSHIGNLTDLYAAFNAAQPLDSAGFSYEIGRPRQHVLHELAKANLWVRTGTAGKLSLIYARQYNLRQEFDRHNPRNDSLAALQLPELHYEITTHSADLLWEHNRWHNFTGTVGVSGWTQANTYEGRFFIPNYRSHTGGAFLIERYRIKQLTLEAGVRYDYRWLQAFMWRGSEIYSPQHSWSNVSGSVGALWRPKDHWTLRANAGTAWRSPTVNELYSNGLHHGAAAIERGDSTLDMERAYNFVASANWTEEKKVRAQLDVYHNFIRDFIYLRPVFPAELTIRGAFPSFAATQADARFTGADLSASVWLLPRVIASGRASMLRAFNVTADDYLILMPADRFSAGLRYEAKESRNIREPYVSAEGTFVRRQNRVPANSDYVNPPQEYFLLEAEVGMTLQFGYQKVLVGVSGRNLLNTRYRDYLNRFRYYADEMGRNITFRITVPFDTHRLENELDMNHPH